MKRLLFTGLIAGAITSGLYAQDPGAKPAPTGAPQAEKPAGDLTDPLEILKKADEATKKVKSVRYTTDFRGTGSQEKAPHITGTVILGGEKTTQAIQKFRFEVKLEDAATKEVTELIAASDGEHYWLVDHRKKTVVEDIDDTALGDFRRLILNVGMREFVHPQPFSDEINGQKSELQGAEKIGDQDCYKIHVIYAQNQGEAVWWFSKKDFLPRGVERMIRSLTGNTGTTILKATDMAVDPAFVTDPFKVTVPEGYKKEGGEPPKPAGEQPPKKPEDTPEPKKPEGGQPPKP